MLLGIVGEDKYFFDKYIKDLKYYEYEDEHIKIFGTYIRSGNGMMLFYDGPLTNNELNAYTFMSQQIPMRWGFWDAENKIVFLCTDHISLKKVYYTLYDGNFIFSSNLEILVKALGSNEHIDYKSLNLYYLYGFIPPPHTLFKGIFKLGPGECIYYSVKDHDRYLTITSHLKLRLKTMKEMQISYALNLLRLAIKEAIGSIITDILGHKIAISMGGGLDTATILAMIKDLDPIAITVVNLGEHQLARTICDFLGVNLIELYIDEDRFIKALEPSFQALQEPMAGLDIVPQTYIVLSEAKSRGADIIVTGDGGDEAFFRLSMDISVRISI